MVRHPVIQSVNENECQSNKRILKCCFLKLTNDQLLSSDKSLSISNPISRLLLCGAFLKQLYSSWPPGAKTVKPRSSLVEGIEQHCRTMELFSSRSLTILQNHGALQQEELNNTLEPWSSLVVGEGKLQNHGALQQQELKNTVEPRSSLVVGVEQHCRTMELFSSRS